jgi:hypothetical protein
MKPVRPLVIIPARAGSKQVQNKNFKALPNGESLLTLAIAFGQSIGAVVVVSSDHPKYQKDFLYRDKWVVGVNRPKALASDEAVMADVVAHALETVKGPPLQPILLFQPTTPFRDKLAVRKCLWSAKRGFPAATVSRIPSRYKRAVCLWRDMTIDLPPRRQLGDEKFIFTGECYAFRRDKGWPILGRWTAVCTPERLNVDTHEDWQQVERELWPDSDAEFRRFLTTAVPKSTALPHSE